jgi:hypothetical protein
MVIENYHLTNKETFFKDNIGFLMANHICIILFDCWNQAAFNELIPSYSYWRTLSSLASRCGSQVIYEFLNIIYFEKY